VGTVTVPPVGARRLPFALGVVLTGPIGTPVVTVTPTGTRGWTVEGRDQRALHRLRVALAAHEAGFFLLDVVEIDAQLGVSAEQWAWLWSLAMRTDAEALLVLGLGPGERQLLEPMAAELRLVVHDVPYVPPARIRLPDDDPAAPGVLAADGRDPAGEHGEGERFAPPTARADVSQRHPREVT
jgi:hypothetical protein